MIGNKRKLTDDFQSNLAEVDAHVIQPEEYEELPELTDEMLASADMFEGEICLMRGQPLSERTKKTGSIPLDLLPQPS